MYTACNESLSWEERAKPEVKEPVMELEEGDHLATYCEDVSPVPSADKISPSPPPSQQPHEVAPVTELPDTVQPMELPQATVTKRKPPSEMGTDSPPPPVKYQTLETDDTSSPSTDTTTITSDEGIFKIAGLLKIRRKHCENLVDKPLVFDMLKIDEVYSKDKNCNKIYTILDDYIHNIVLCYNADEEEMRRVARISCVKATERQVRDLRLEQARQFGTATAAPSPKTKPTLDNES